MESAEYELMFQVEEEHWWYRALHRLLFFELGRRLPGWREAAILDAGCGTGALLKQLGNPEKHQGIDLAPEAIEFCRKRGLSNVRLGDIGCLPYANASFDAVICSSVLYHCWIKDVNQALRELGRVLRPGGLLLVNLPAYEFLRSAHDTAVFGARRFTQGPFTSALETCGYEVQRMTYWTTLPFPAAWIARTLGGSRKGRDFQPGKSHGYGNAFMNQVMRVEFALLKRFALPFGVALLAVARKRAS